MAPPGPHGQPCDPAGERVHVRPDIQIFDQSEDIDWIEILEETEADEVAGNTMSIDEFTRKVLADADEIQSISEPTAEAMARGAALRAELVQQAGGALGASAVAKILGLRRRGIEERRCSKQLLAVESGSGHWLYPACQFSPDQPRGVLKGLEEYLKAFTVPDGWTQLSVLLTRAPALGSRTCLEALQQGDVVAAVAVARGFGEHGA